MSTCRRIRLDVYFRHKQKPTPNVCIKDLNIRPETPKTLEEKVGKTFQDTGLGKGFLKRTQSSGK